MQAELINLQRGINLASPVNVSAPVLEGNDTDQYAKYECVNGAAIDRSGRSSPHILAHLDRQQADAALPCVGFHSFRTRASE